MTPLFHFWQRYWELYNHTIQYTSKRATLDLIARVLLVSSLVIFYWSSQGARGAGRRSSPTGNSFSREGERGHRSLPQDRGAGGQGAGRRDSTEEDAQPNTGRCVGTGKGERAGVTHGCVCFYLFGYVDLSRVFCVRFRGEGTSFRFLVVSIWLWFVTS